MGRVASATGPAARRSAAFSIDPKHAGRLKGATTKQVARLNLRCAAATHGATGRTRFQIVLGVVARLAALLPRAARAALLSTGGDFSPIGPMLRKRSRYSLVWGRQKRATVEELVGDAEEANASWIEDLASRTHWSFNLSQREIAMEQGEVASSGIDEAWQHGGRQRILPSNQNDQAAGCASASGHESASLWPRPKRRLTTSQQCSPFTRPDCRHHDPGGRGRTPGYRTDSPPAEG